VVKEEEEEEEEKGGTRGEGLLFYGLAFVRNFRPGRKIEECNPKALTLHNN
jgi:hypothetical protein